MAAVAWLVLERAIIALNGTDSELAKAVGHDRKAKASGLLYAAAIGLAFLRPWIADVVYALVALLWIVPDRRIEGAVTRESDAIGGRD
jgi:uncharacterized membrane protein